jgi:hypothetical protein
MDPVIFIVVPAIVLVVWGIAKLARASEIREARERHNARRRWGQSKGFKIADEPDPNPRFFGTSYLGINDERLDPFRDIKLIPMGTSYNFQEGCWEGRSVHVFDHRYVISTGKTTTVVEHSVVATQLQAELPTFELRPHHLWDHVRAMFGHRDIEIGAGTFDRRFYISSGDELFIIRALDAKVQGRLLKYRGESWHCLNGYLVYVASGFPSEEYLDRMLDDLVWFVSWLEHQS